MTWHMEANNEKGMKKSGIDREEIWERKSDH
jgi:hypothetical protein